MSISSFRMISQNELDNLSQEEIRTIVNAISTTAFYTSNYITWSKSNEETRLFISEEGIEMWIFNEGTWVLTNTLMIFGFEHFPNLEKINTKIVRSTFEGILRDRKISNICI